MARALVGSATGSVELPITPMLDMTFQLLFFLILAFRGQPLTEGKVDFALPATPGSDGSLTVPPVGVDPVAADALPVTIVVRTLRDGVNDGNISALIVRAPEGEILVPNLEALRRDLQGRCREPGGSARVQIAAETRVKYACIIDVVDACLRAGFQSVGFAPPPDLGVN